MYCDIFILKYLFELIIMLIYSVYFYLYSEIYLHVHCVFNYVSKVNSKYFLWMNIFSLSFVFIRNWPSLCQCICLADA